MIINTYDLRLNDERVGELVKEATVHHADIDRIRNPEDAAKIFDKLFDLSNRTQELFVMLALNISNKVTGAFEVARGTLTSSLVHPREIFIRAILSGAASIIVAHNHPSGELDISAEDFKVTARIREAGELLGIRLFDHLVIAGGSHVSVE